MGQLVSENSRRRNFLVVMTNKDVVHITPEEAERLDTLIIGESVYKTFVTTDAKTKAKTRIRIDQISTVVEDTRDAR